MRIIGKLLWFLSGIAVGGVTVLAVQSHLASSKQAPWDTGGLHATLQGISGTTGDICDYDVENTTERDYDLTFSDAPELMVREKGDKGLQRNVEGIALGYPLFIPSHQTQRIEITTPAKRQRITDLDWVGGKSVAKATEDIPRSFVLFDRLHRKRVDFPECSIEELARK